MQVYIAVDPRWSVRYCQGLMDYMEGEDGDYQILYETVCLFLYHQHRIDEMGNPADETTRLMWDIVQGAHLMDIPFPLVTSGWMDLYRDIRPIFNQLSGNYTLDVIEPHIGGNGRLLGLEVRCWNE